MARNGAGWGSMVWMVNGLEGGKRVLDMGVGLLGSLDGYRSVSSRLGGRREEDWRWFAFGWVGVILVERWFLRC